MPRSGSGVDFFGATTRARSRCPGAELRKVQAWPHRSARAACGLLLSV